MGTATQMVRVEAEIEVPTEHLMRVLVIDDEEDVTESWRRLFEGLGYSVSTARDPQGALDLLKREHFDVIVSDIVFEDSNVTGDQLIAENFSLMSQASVVAITAHAKDRIRRAKELSEMGVTILEKGKGDNELEETVIHKLEQRKVELANFAENSLTTLIGEAVRSSPTPGDPLLLMKQPSLSVPAGEAFLVHKIKGVLTDWFRTRKNPDKKSIVYGGRAFSPNELAQEVESGTEVGLEHLETMVDLFKECINVK